MSVKRIHLSMFLKQALKCYWCWVLDMVILEEIDIHNWSVMCMQSLPYKLQLSKCYASNPAYYFHQIFIFDIVKHQIICCSLFLITCILWKLRSTYFPQQLASCHYNIRAKLKSLTVFCSFLDWLDCVASLWQAWGYMNVGNLKCTGMSLSWVSTEELSSVVQVALGSPILPIN